MGITLNPIGSYLTGVFDEGGAEIVAHDPATQRLFITNGNDNTVDVVSIADPESPVKLFTLVFPAPFEDLAPTSVAVKNGVVAVAVPADPATDPGHVLFFDTDGSFHDSVEVGALPDMLTFTPDGKKVLVANEGEPDDGIDPDGSVSIIDISSSVGSATVETATFAEFNGREEELQDRGVRLFPDKQTAEDVEPEYIAVSPDGTKAFVTLQENNAFGVVDIATAMVEDILPLGVKDHATGQPQLETIDLTDMLPDLGTTAAGQTLKLGGLSGLWYEGITDEGIKEFWTVPDRGPNPDTIAGERPFALPDYQARLHKIEVAADGTTQFTDTIFLTREEGGILVPITGISNNASDEPPIDIFGDPLDFDAFGGDMEGVARDSDGNFWLVDEYRPAIYKFAPDGVLIDRFVPDGTAALVGDDAGDYGSETLPEDYASRRPNRGFEAVAVDQENDVVYAFIQTPLANPDRDASDNSDVIRILGVDGETGEPVSEYVYLLEGLDFHDSIVDKIGDAVYAGDGSFYVVERDSSTEAFGKKYIFKVDLEGATNLLDPGAPDLPAGETLEQQTAGDLADLGIQAVNKIKMLNLPSIGYLAGDKPEGLALLDDGRLAVLNDNDFSLTGGLDTTTGEVGVVEPTSPTVLGFITFDDDNGLDASDEDSAINIQNWPIYGLYMPDAIASFEVDGQAFYITANEGDARDEDARIKDLDLDPDAFPNAAELQADENLGRLAVSTIDGDIDGDGDYDQLFAYGSRSFSIWDQFGNLVFDSGDDFEKTVAEYVPEYFNSDNDESTFDTRSDAKGPEPEGVAIGAIDGTPYAFIGLERVGGVMTYDVSDPTNPRFVGYDNNRDFTADPETVEAGDLAPEGLAFISPDDSPNGEPLLVVANEVSGSTTFNEIDETFTLQLLHASDLEGGVDAIGRAPNFAAIIDALEDSTDVEASVTISAGDNYISGPFFSAAGDGALREPLQSVNTQLFEDLLGGEELSNLREASGRVDISIMNIVGYDASALGNHEFDLGTSTIAEIIGTDIRGDTLGDVRWLGSQFPYLSANLDFSGDDNLSGLFTEDILPNTAFQSLPDDLDAAADAPKIAPSTTIEVNGELIGVVGATTPLLETISSPGDTSIKDPGAGTNDMAALATILQPVVDDLIAEGINKIVLTTHLQQITLEQELIPLLSGVDISIAGGSDTLLANDDDVLRPGDAAAGPYPIVTTDFNGNPAVIVSTDGEYSYVGRLVVNFNADGILVDGEGNPIDETEDLDPTLNGPIATTEENVEALWGDADPFAEGTKGALTKELTDAVADVVNTKDGNVFGESEVFLDGRREQVRTEQTNLGDVTADANLEVAQGYDDTVLVSIKNGGGIRAPIGEVANDGDETAFLPPQANSDAGKEEGQVSQLDDENALRFNNELTLLTLTPEQLLEVLEHGVAATEDGATPGQFPQVGGIKFSFDPDQAPGGRVQSAAIVTDDQSIPIVEDGEVVEGAPEAIRVVTLNFMADGGDDYPFADFAAADPGFVNRVDLVDELTDPGLVDFADPGTEQDALAEYFAENHPVDGGTPFDMAETPIEEDIRIQNLEFRDDTVLDDDVDGPSLSVEITYFTEQAWYANTFGIYNIETGEAQILETNTDLDTNENLSSGDVLVTLELTSEEYDNLGYFIVGNGDRLNDYDDLDLKGATVAENAQGSYGIQLADGSFLIGAGAPAFFSEAGLNSDGENHFDAYGSDTETVFLVEDLVGLGDQDFNDLIYTVTIAPNEESEADMILA